MIAKNLSQFAVINWENYKTTVGIASKNEEGVALVEGDSEIYNFDKICQSIFSKNEVPTSVDGICFSDSAIQLVEFKSGFKQKITKKNFDVQKAKCDDTEKICTKYWDLFWENQKRKIKELLFSIRLKAIESYIILEKQFFPICDDIQSGKQLKLVFTVVVDADGVDGIEDTLAELSNKNPEIDNSLISIRRSLKRLLKQKDIEGYTYFFDEIEVLTATDYQIRIKNIS